jgi:hypothetical protein
MKATGVVGRGLFASKKPLCLKSDSFFCKPADAAMLLE